MKAIGRNFVKWQAAALTAAVLGLLTCAHSPMLAEEGEAPAAETAPTEAKDSKSAVHGWFAKYDQIRRNAELNFGEKLQCRGILEKGLAHAKQNDKNSTLAHKMVCKYSAAAAAMQELPSLAATAELQRGYTEFFNKGHELFQDCLGSEHAAPASKAAIEAKRKNLEALDKKNKHLDEELRKKFGVARHKHI